MELTKEERQKLEQQANERFHLQELNKDQAEFSTGRKLSDDAWQAYTIINQNVEKKRKTNNSIYSIRHLCKEPKVKQKPKFTLKDVAKHAAIKGQRRNLRNQNNE